MKKINKKGFTIVELVIVIAVIAILAAVLIPTFAGVVNRANYSAAEQSARNAVTAGLQMTSNAVLPEGTKIFVDADKNGKVDYAFNYTGNAMVEYKMYSDGNVVGTIFDSAQVDSSKNPYKFNNLLIPTDQIDKKVVYTKTPDTALSEGKTYYTLNSTTKDYDAVSSPDKESIATYYEMGEYLISRDTEVKTGKKYYTKGTDTYTLFSGTTFAEGTTYYEFTTTKHLTTVLENDIKALLNPTSENVVTLNYYADGTIGIIKGTASNTNKEIYLTVFTSTDMPMTAFVLVYLG